MDAENKTYLSVREAAEYIGYSTRYVYRLTALNVLPHYTPNGGRIFFKRVELDEWIATNGKQTGNARIHWSSGSYKVSKRPYDRCSHSPQQTI